MKRECMRELNEVERLRELANKIEEHDRILRIFEGEVYVDTIVSFVSVLPAEMFDELVTFLKELVTLRIMQLDNAIVQLRNENLIHMEQVHTAAIDQKIGDLNIEVEETENTFGESDKVVKDLSSESKAVESSESETPIPLSTPIKPESKPMEVLRIRGADHIGEMVERVDPPEVKEVPKAVETPAPPTSKCAMPNIHTLIEERRKNFGHRFKK